MGRATVPVLAQAAITNYHRLGVLDNKHLFLTVQEAGKSKIKVPANLVPGENTLSGLQIDIFLYFHMAERKKNLLTLPLLMRVLISP